MPGFLAQNLMKASLPALTIAIFIAMGAASPERSEAAAGAAAVAAAAASISVGRVSTVVEIPEGSDGYVKSTKFYRDGPHYRFCREDSRVVFKKGCVLRKPVEAEVFGLKYTKFKRTLNTGMTAQELLDARFGPGTTEVTRYSVKNDAVFYLFYRAIKSE